MFKIINKHTIEKIFWSKIKNDHNQYEMNYFNFNKNVENVLNSLSIEQGKISNFSHDDYIYKKYDDIDEIFSCGVIPVMIKLKIIDEIKDPKLTDIIWEDISSKFKNEINNNIFVKSFNLKKPKSNKLLISPNKKKYDTFLKNIIFINKDINQNIKNNKIVSYECICSINRYSKGITSPRSTKYSINIEEINYGIINNSINDIEYFLLINNIIS